MTFVGCNTTLYQVLVYVFLRNQIGYLANTLIANVWCEVVPLDMRLTLYSYEGVCGLQPLLDWKNRNNRTRE